MTTSLSRPISSRNGQSPVIVRPAQILNAGTGTARRWQHQYSRRLRITDSLIVCAAVALAQYIRFGDSAFPDGYPGALMTLYSALFAALWLFSIAMFHARSIRVIGAGIEEYRRIVSGSVWTFGIIAMTTLLAKIFLARRYLAVALPVGTLSKAIGPVNWSTVASLRRKQMIA